MNDTQARVWNSLKAQAAAEMGQPLPEPNRVDDCDLEEGVPWWTAFWLFPPGTPECHLQLEIDEEACSVLNDTLNGWVEGVEFMLVYRGPQMSEFFDWAVGKPMPEGLKDVFRRFLKTQ